MKPTKEYIEQKFRDFNQMCFEGRLPTVEIQMSRARSYLGQLGYRRKRTLFGRTTYSDFVIRISTQMDQTEAEVEDTLLHEMIHLYIAHNRLKDTSTHGRLFRQLMNELNQRFQRHITISHRRTREEQDRDTQQRLHLLCVSTWDNGQRGITIAAKSRLFQLWEVMPTFPSVKATEWYATTDPYFNRFPRALTPKIYRIAQKELDEHLSGARPLVRQGGRIFVKRT